MVLQPTRRTDQGVLLPLRWALTPPFHPYHPFGWRSFSVTLLYPHEYQAINLRGALRCSDFPPPPKGGSDRAHMRCKYSSFFSITQTVIAKLHHLFCTAMHIVEAICQRYLRCSERDEGYGNKQDYNLYAQRIGEP